MKTIYWGLLSLWLALAGCTKGVDDEPTPAGATPATDETPFYGTIETDADTRCATKDSDGQIDVHWNPTDEIALFKGCPLCSCYGVQPTRTIPATANSISRKEPTATPVRRRDDRIRRQLCAPSLLRRWRGLRQGRRRTDDDLLAARPRSVTTPRRTPASAAYR